MAWSPSPFSNLNTVDSFKATDKVVLLDSNSGTARCATGQQISDFVLGQTVKQSKGIAAIPNGQSSVVVNHTLGVPPNIVISTAQNSLGALTIYADTFTATTFTLHTSGNVGVNTTFSWLVE